MAWHTQNFVEKIFADGSQTTKFVKVLCIKSLQLRSMPSELIN